MGQQESCATVRVGGVNHFVRPGSSLTIGRSQDNDVVIGCSSVSRFHVSIRWHEGRALPEVCDLGSQNGTRVGGEEVVRRPVTLRPGVSVLTVGERVVRVRVRSCECALLSDTSDEVALATQPGAELAGRLRKPSDVIEVMLRVERERLTGTLHVVPEEGVRARVTFGMGRVMAVRKGEALRTRALEQILRGSTPGRYRFGAGFEPVDLPMNLWFSQFLDAWLSGKPTPRSHRRDAM